jgi:hypothetical protein
MFQLFSRVRGRILFKGGPGDGLFRARSAARDAQTDRARAGSILDAINRALKAAEQEQAGLSARIDDVLARAAVTFGNGTDEYLYRDALDTHHQDLFDIEIANGRRRLKELATAITHFHFLRVAALSRFPESTNNFVKPR